jgi:hypothetical protein
MRLCYEREQKTGTDFAAGHSPTAVRNDNDRAGCGPAFLSETLWSGVSDDFHTPSLKSAGQTFYAALRHA